MKLPAAILGATGTVGQRFVRRLADHPWLEPVHLAASARSAGRAYGQAVRWIEPVSCPEVLLASPVHDLEPVPGIRVVFSALDAASAGPAEEAWRAAGALVVSNSAAHRLDEDVPLLVPEVNGHHAPTLLARQAGPGAILCQPNCTTTGLVLALAPLVEPFGLERVHLVSLQASSGAGLTGPTFLELADNVVPHIAGEAEKLAQEAPRILGRLANSRVVPLELPVEATCTRVPVLEGHLLCLTLDLARPARREELVHELVSWRGHPAVAGLPSAPPVPLVLHEEQDAPQPRRHRDLHGGMAVSLGGLHGSGRRWHLRALVHNTERGAARGAILSAELALREGWIPGLTPSSPA